MAAGSPASQHREIPPRLLQLPVWRRKGEIKDNMRIYKLSEVLLQMYLVTGGWTGSISLDSTELYDPSLGSWTVAGARLPSAGYGLRAANIDNRILVFGKNIFYRFRM